MSRFIKLAVFAAVLGLSLWSAADESAQVLYERAVAAYERDDYLRALQFVNQSLKLAPDSKQAQKLKQLIDVSLHSGESGSGTGAAPDSVWSYSPGENSLESDPESIHVFHSAMGATTQPAYATMALHLPAKCTEYEVIFKMKFGASGSLSSGTCLRSGTKILNSVTADATGYQHFGALGKKKVDGAWHEYRIRWRGGQTEFFCDEELLAKGPCEGIPDLLQFGSQTGKSGRQIEAWFQWVGLNYNMPSAG